VSLSGGFGELRLGRDYTPTFWNDTVFDPFGTNGVGTNLISTANTRLRRLRHPRSFDRCVHQRAAPATTFAPATPSATSCRRTWVVSTAKSMYGFSEKTKYATGLATPDVANNSRQGRYVGGRFGYANGPLDVALAYGSSTVGDQF
jgi:predicted porin